jgi:hypothetical protein
MIVEWVGKKGKKEKQRKEKKRKEKKRKEKAEKGRKGKSTLQKPLALKDLLEDKRWV